MHNWTEALPNDDIKKKTWTLIAMKTLEFAKQEGAMLNIDKQRIIKRLVATATLNGVRVDSLWTQAMKGQAKISFELSKCVSEWAKKSALEQKQGWENFLNQYAHPSTAKTNTTSQTAEITFGGVKPRSNVETVIVWNGNGMRARWAEGAGLKEVTKATNPDVLCFLEAKVNAEKLLELKGFEEWVTQAGFSHIYCYWSAQRDGKSHGNEGIVVLSKVPANRVRYGIGNAKFNHQARVISLDFNDWTAVFTYNPQGGFTEASLNFRKEWEEAFQNYLIQMAVMARKNGKRLVWAGDLNVNPKLTDWSPNAFDKIKHKFPRGAQPAGCREEDQRRYREMVEKMSGINVAEHFGKRSTNLLHRRAPFQQKLRTANRPRYRRAKPARPEQQAAHYRV